MSSPTFVDDGDICRDRSTVQDRPDCVFHVHEISEIRGSPRSSVPPEDEVARSLAIGCSLSDEEISRSNNYLQNNRIYLLRGEVGS